MLKKKKKQVGGIWGAIIEVANWWLIGRVEQLLHVHTAIFKITNKRPIVKKLIN